MLICLFDILYACMNKILLRLIRLPRVALCVVGLVSLLLFVILSKYEDRPFIRNLDFAVTVKVQEKIDRSAHLRLASFVDTMMTGTTFFASPEFTSAVVIILTGLALYDRKKKSWNGKAFVILTGFVAIVLVELYGKSIVHHPSPPFSMIKHATSIFPANYINEQFSYPSGHAARAVFVSIISYLSFSIYHLALRKRLIFGLCLGSYVLLVSISRIYLGHHWFSDIIGGMLLSSGFAFAVLTFAPVDGQDKPHYNRKVHE